MSKSTRQGGESAGSLDHNIAAIDVIDFRNIVNLIWAHSLWILVAGLLPAALTFAALSLRQPNYTAQSIVLVSSKSFVFDLETLETTTAIEQLDISSLLLIAKSDAVLNRVFNAFDDDTVFLAAFDNYQVLGQALEFTVDAGNEVATLSLSMGDAALAANVVNAWAAEFVKQTNFVFLPSAQRRELLAQKLMEQAEALNLAQADLESFLRTQQIDALTRQMQNLDVVLHPFFAVNEEGELQSDHPAFNFEITPLNDLYREAGEIRGVIADLDILRQQVEAVPNPSAAASIAQGYAFIELQRRASSIGQVDGLDLTINADSLGGPTANEIDVLTRSLEDRLAFTQEQIELHQGLTDAELTVVLDSIVSGLDDPHYVEALALRQALQSQLESENAELQKLTNSRDLSYESYVAIQREIQELAISENATNNVLVIASEATAPQLPVTSNRVAYTVLVLLSGASLMIATILFKDWWLLQSDLE
jgi:uncharacterized protein involved in exopolysaccharide biosynthesis